MTFDEGLARLNKLYHSGKAFFIESSPDVPTHAGECRITEPADSGFDVLFDGSKTFSFPLNVHDLRFETASPLSLPAVDLERIPKSIHSASGLLLIAPGDRSLFLVELP